MKEVIRTNNPALISFVEALLAQAGISYFVADRNISVVEGSIGAFPQRILVPDDIAEAACRLLIDANLGDELKMKK